MNIILHIGQSKTGTTAIQSFLSKNRKKLIEQNILYPDYYINGHPLHALEHNAFAEALCDTKRYPYFDINTYIKQFYEEAEEKNCSTILLSGESFFGAPHIWRLENKESFLQAYTEKLKNLKNLTKNHTVTIIGYFRRPEEWIETAISHVIRYEGLYDKKMYEDDIQLYEYLKPHINYPKLLSLWEEIIHPKRMHIRPYERSQLYKNDALADFLMQLNLNSDDYDMPKEKQKTHNSIDRRYIEAKKLINQKGVDKISERIILECMNQLNKKRPFIEKYSLPEKVAKKIQLDCAYIYDEMEQYNTTKDHKFYKEKYPLLSYTKKITAEEATHYMQEIIFLKNTARFKVLSIKMRLKSLLRNRYIYLYAIIKNIYYAFLRPNNLK